MAKTLKTTLLLAGKLDASFNKAFSAAEKAAKVSGGKIESTIKKIPKTAKDGINNLPKTIEQGITTSVEKTLSKAEKAVKTASNRIGSTLKKTGQIAKKAGVAVAAGATAATLAIGAFTTAAAQNAAALESSMANVGTLLDGTAEQVKARTQELSADVIKVSNATGISTDELSSGLYDVISAVGDTEDSIKIMEIAAKAAAAGNAETAEAVSLLTAVTKGYGDTSGEAFQKASDLAFQTVKLGQTTFPELAASIGKVTPLASALGVQQEELFGIFATLTGVTGSAAEVATQYKSILAGLMTPSEGMATALESMGYATGSAAIEALGFQGTLQALMGTVDGDTQSMAKLFSSVEAQTAILSLCGAQADNLTSKTDAMRNSANATNNAFSTQTDTLEYTIQKIKNLGQNFMTQVGQKILPYVAELASKALPMITQALDDIMPAIDAIASKAGPVFEKIAAKVGPVLLEGIQEIPNILQKVGTVAGNIYAKVKPYIGTVKDLISEIPGIFDTVSGKAQEVWAILSPVVSTIIQKVQEIAPVIIGCVSEAISWIMRIGKAIAPVVAVLAATLAPVIQEIIPILSILWDVVGQIVHLIEQVSPVLTAIVGVLGLIATQVAGSIISVLKSAMTIVQDVIRVVGDLFDILTNLGLFVVNVLTGNFAAAFGNLANIVKAAWDGIKAVVHAGLVAIVSPINALIEGANKAIGVFKGKKIPKIEIPAFAQGATVSEPTLAWVGEGRDKETIIPHNNSPRSRALLAEAERGVYGSSGGKKEMSFVYAPVINGAGDSIKAELLEDYERFKEWMQRYKEEDDREVFA